MEAEKAGSKLTAKQKAILQVQRSLLSRNIVWSPALAASLKAHNLLTDSMIAEVEAAEGAENKIHTMLDLLPLRTSQVYDKFADALQVAGHGLIADFLREEDQSKNPLNLKDLQKRLPFFFRNMKDHEKQEIENYMAEKIQTGILQATWQVATKDKDKALIAKQEQIEQAFVYEEELKKKQDQLLEAQRQIIEAREESMAARAELRALEQNVAKLKEHMKEKLDTQLKFSMANDSIANRLAHRLQTAENTLSSIRERLNSVVQLDPRDSGKDALKKEENPFVFLLEDVELFMDQFKKLLVFKVKYEDLREERDLFLQHLGRHIHHSEDKAHDHDAETASLAKAYAELSSQHDQQVQSLRTEVARYGQLLEDVARAREQEDRRLASAGGIWQSAILSVMRRQLQDLKAAMRKKESTLQIKDEEIAKKRGRIQELEAALAARTKELADQTMSAGTVTSERATVNGCSPRSTPDGPVALSTSPTPTKGRQQAGLPPLRSSALGKSSLSPKGGAQARAPPRPAVAPPRGMVVEQDTPLTIYPAGLTTLQLHVHRDDGKSSDAADLNISSANNNHRVSLAMNRPHPLPEQGGQLSRGKTQMVSSIGDLKAMHGKTHVPATRSVPGLGLEVPAGQMVARSAGVKGLSSPSVRRKVPARMK